MSRVFQPCKNKCNTDLITLLYDTLFKRAGVLSAEVQLLSTFVLPRPHTHTAKKPKGHNNIFF